MNVLKRKIVGAVSAVAASAATSPVSAHGATIANPASTYCVAQGGRSVLRGGTGYCHLRNGRVVEEWTFFRQRAGKADALKAAVDISNPAAERCATVGGRNVTRRDTDGSEAAYCRLKDGRIVDAWKLFRRSNGKPVPRRR